MNAHRAGAPSGRGAASEKGGRHHPRNTLNNLSGRDWLKFTKSWFVYDGPPRSRSELLHPAKFPEGMIADFVRFFTKRGELVLDPFAGTGSTLVACRETGRRGIGIELQAKYADIARSRLTRPRSGATAAQLVVRGNARSLDALWARRGWPPVDFAITSPPYWNMLRNPRGGVVSSQRLRGIAGLDQHYSEGAEDLGNIHDYAEFLDRTTGVFRLVGEVLREGRYLVVLAQNVRDGSGIVRPLAWDLAAAITSTGPFDFQGERVWCQDAKRLGIWGYPKVFVPNYHHHYCLIFRRRTAPVTSVPTPAAGPRRRG